MLINKFNDIVYKAVLKNALMPEARLNDALKQASSLGCSLMSVIAKDSSVDHSAIMKLVAGDLGLEYVSLKSSHIDRQMADKIPHRFAWHYKFVPVMIEGRILTIAVSSPLDTKTQDELRLHFGYDIKMVISTEEDVLETLNTLYGLGSETIEKMMSQPKDSIAVEKSQQEDVQDIEKLAGDASVINLVNQIILEAYKKRATDIHIESYRGEPKLRYRIDGILYDTNVSPHIKQFLLPILSRIKIMANLNIVERRLPQDGRAIVKVQEHVIDLRVSFIPTPHGESLVIRILPAGMLFSLEKLGLSSENQRVFENFINKPHGIIFVTGPTGSGKTTTLYTCLSRINKKTRKIITIEDPIEYEMPGVTQIQVSSETGLSFARGLRSILRHDPDIIMIGEVRDLETAEIAIRVALTGHLVLSTLHTNDAPSGITRLIDIGVEPYLVASSVEAFIAQRLVRTICQFCKIEDDSQIPQIKRQIAQEIDYKIELIKLYKGKGCEECNFTGYLGRTAIFEIMAMNNSLKEIVLNKPSSKAIRKMAIHFGMRTLRQDGWFKVIEGKTTPEEIMRVTQEDKDDTEPSESDNAKIKSAKMSQTQVVQNRTGYNNKRIFERLDIGVPIFWKVCPPEKEKEIESQPETLSATKNISAGGLLFGADESFPIGTVLELRIDLPKEESITTFARVLRIEEIEMDKAYDIAVCFLGLSGADRMRLKKFVSAIAED